MAEKKEFTIEEDEMVSRDEVTVWYHRLGTNSCSGVTFPKKDIIKLKKCIDDYLSKDKGEL